MNHTKPNSGPIHRSSIAFSQTELLVSIAVLAVIVLLLLPKFVKVSNRAPRIACVNNLKQIGIGFRLAANDHDGLYPTDISTNNGGSLEFTSGKDTFRHFQTDGEGIGSPKVLVCPNDTRRPATNFAELKNENISYFVTLNANETNANMLLAGDRNLARKGRVLRSGVYDLSTNEPMGWTGEIHKFTGNLVLADGSVQPVTAARLNEQIRISELTNRVSIP